MTISPRTTRLRALAAAACMVLVVTACGDDDDEASPTSTTVAEGDGASTSDDFCAASAELDSGEGPPTAEQFEELKELAPDEISAEVDLAADAFIEADGDFGAAFAVEGVEDAVEAIEAWEAENCENEFAVAPEHQEYCDAVEELDSQDGPPTVEQVQELKELRPDSIGEETDMVVDAFVEADGDIGVIFSDPELSAAFEAMEAHDAEICGFEVSEDEEPDTEAAEGAEVIPVTAVDFAFEGIPAEINAGPIAFEFANEGEAAHELVLFKLGEGVDLDELLASEEDPSEEEAQEAGGTFTPPGGEVTYANTELEPGTYAAVCFIPGPEGKPHYELGMKTTFTVT